MSTVTTARQTQYNQRQSLPARIAIYLAERFPPFRFGIMVSAFAFSGLCLSQALRGVHPLPSLPIFATAAVATFLLFFQLRVADEFKDYEQDCRYQPYRPVPRGLVTLRELSILAYLAGLLQTVLVAFCSFKLLIPLVATWLYMGLMTKEFFAANWLRSRPLAYLATHMFVMVFIDLFITSCDWLREGASLPSGIYAFLCLSICNGLIIEIGRKIQAPAQEEEGVQTYTSLWGIRTACSVWTALLLTGLLFAVLTASLVHFAVQTMVMLTLAVVIAVSTALLFQNKPSKILSERIELLSGLWVIFAYTCLGILPTLIPYLVPR